MALGLESTLATIFIDDLIIEDPKHYAPSRHGLNNAGCHAAVGHLQLGHFVVVKAIRSWVEAEEVVPRGLHVGQTEGGSSVGRNYAPTYKPQEDGVQM